MQERDGMNMRSALQAEFEAETDGTYTTMQEGGETDMERENAMQQGLNAAQQAAQEEGMSGKVEELAQRLGQDVQATNQAGQADQGALDGFRYDHDDNTNA